jgi:molecular chaperone GrpE
MTESEKTYQTSDAEHQDDIPTNEEQMTNEIVNETENQETATADEGETAAAEQRAELEQLQARVSQLEKESAEHRDAWLRAVADYKNFKRRTDQERGDLIRSASAGLLMKLLPVVDDMERALASTPAEVASTPWFEGVKLIAQKLQTILESEGVTAIEAVGKDFDPNFHEAVIYEAAENGQDGKVVAELQKGYKLRDRVLRPTMVKVGQG